jgi:hypothetical protein
MNSMLNQGVERVSNILATREYYSRKTNIHRREYSFWQYSYECKYWLRPRRIVVGGYIAALGHIYALYINRTSNFSPSGRISAMYSSMLGPPMMYITYINSKSSVFETIRVNKGMNTCLILASIEYSRVFVLVLRANTREYKYSDIREYSRVFIPKNEYEYEYWIANIRTRKYILVPYLVLNCQQHNRYAI